jgi:small subunit ribosomal protein S2
MLRKNIDIFTLNTLLNQQIHIGKKKSKWSKSLNLYLFGFRHNIAFFNLKKTKSFITKLIFFLEKAIIRHHSFLFVGNGSLLNSIIKYLSIELKQAYSNIMWVGGTLTSWFSIRNYARRLYKKDLYQETLRSFALKANDKIQQKLHRYFIMKGRLKGLETGLHFPNMIICLDKISNEYALHEAFVLQIPVICILNSDHEFSRITYPILGNNVALESLSFYSNVILNSIKSGFIKRRIQFSKINYIVLKNNYYNKIASVEHNFKLLNLFIKSKKKYTCFLLKNLIRLYTYSSRFQSIRTKRLKRMLSLKKFN